MKEKISSCIYGEVLGDILYCYLNKNKRGKFNLKEFKETNNSKITESTKMMLLSLNGLLFGLTRKYKSNIIGPLENYVFRSYLDWYNNFNKRIENNYEYSSWISFLDFINEGDNIDNSIFTSLKNNEMGTLKVNINNIDNSYSLPSIIPIALYFHDKDNLTYELGMKVGAITHSNTSYLVSCYFLTILFNRLIYTDNNLLEAIEYAYNYLDNLSSYKKEAKELKKIINNVVKNKIISNDNSFTSYQIIAETLHALFTYDDISSLVNYIIDNKKNEILPITFAILGILIGKKELIRYFNINISFKGVLDEVIEDFIIGKSISKENINNISWICKYVNVEVPSHFDKYKIKMGGDSTKKSKYKDTYLAKLFDKEDDIKKIKREISHFDNMVKIYNDVLKCANNEKLIEKLEILIFLIKLGGSRKVDLAKYDYTNTNFITIDEDLDVVEYILKEFIIEDERLKEEKLLIQYYEKIIDDFLHLFQENL